MAGVNLYGRCGRHAIAALTRFLLPGVYVYLRVWLTDSPGEVHEEPVPSLRLIGHVYLREKLGSWIVVRIASALDALVTESIRIVEVYALRKYIEPYVDVVPVENRRSHLLPLDFHRLGAVLDSVVLVIEIGRASCRERV